MGGETLLSRFQLWAVEAAVMLFHIILGLGLETTAQKAVFYTQSVERQLWIRTVVLLHVAVIAAIATFNISCYHPSHSLSSKITLASARCPSIRPVRRIPETVQDTKSMEKSKI